ncbi:hypothetical protein DBV15_12117 [Temnothorax longispinosus]|uniref:Uncharacterized protein n=1 Tax=Temnothorax longispinosus TaxID=300112 RepID=A0A4S2L933_9HYME|nr:hypothetical protein DBV15_12117 [Temnothorax longispinosus]
MILSKEPYYYDKHLQNLGKCEATFATFFLRYTSMNCDIAQAAGVLNAPPNALLDRTNTNVAMLKMVQKGTETMEANLTDCKLYVQIIQVLDRLLSHVSIYTHMICSWGQKGCSVAFRNASHLEVDEH